MCSHGSTYYPKTNVRCLPSKLKKKCGSCTTRRGLLKTLASKVQHQSYIGLHHIAEGAAASVLAQEVV